MTPIRLSLALIAALLPGLKAAADDWAFSGFDAVEFLQAERAVPGRSRIVTKWRGRLWHFTSEDNRAAFEANPRAFLPGFDGMCPVSLAEGRQTKGDPRHVAVIGQRVYLLRSDKARQRLVLDPGGILGRAKAAFGSREK